MRRLRQRRHGYIAPLPPLLAVRCGGFAWGAPRHATLSARYARRRFIMTASASSPSPPSSSPAAAAGSGEGGGALTTVRIVCVGDIHDQWSATDARLMHTVLRPDLALFVGDFGNENVPLVRAVASYAAEASDALPPPDDARAACASASPGGTDVAAICGNHDAWFSATKRGVSNCPYDRETEDRIVEQLDALRDVDVGYAHRRVLANLADVAVVGGRPFSWGGPAWRCPEFFLAYYDVADMEQSARRIAASALASQCGDAIFLAHNGPSGLGDRVDSICGRDFGSELRSSSSSSLSSSSSPPPLQLLQPQQLQSQQGGDFGCPDLAQAIRAAKEAGVRVPLCVFGHMHEALKCDRWRRREMVLERDGTLYVNAAVVPRVREVAGSHMRRVDDGEGAAGKGRWARETLHNFTVIEAQVRAGADSIGNGNGSGDDDDALSVASVRQVWISSEGFVASERVLYRDAAAAAATAASVADSEVAAQ